MHIESSASNQQASIRSTVDGRGGIRAEWEMVNMSLLCMVLTDRTGGSMLLKKVLQQSSRGREYEENGGRE